MAALPAVQGGDEVSVIGRRRRAQGLVCWARGHRWRSSAMTTGHCVVMCGRCLEVLHVRFVGGEVFTGHGWAPQPVRSPAFGEATAARHVLAMMTARRVGDVSLLGDLMAESLPRSWDVIDAQGRLLEQLLGFGALHGLGDLRAAGDLHTALAHLVERDVSGVLDG